jgi:hypothetical protein
MNRIAALFVGVTLLLLSAVETAHPQTQKTPPKFFIDKGACPFECCEYRAWKTKKTTIAYARPDARAPQVGKFIAGSEVVAVTGEVHVTPGRFVFKQAIGNRKPGDVMWVYTYLGEGRFKVWSNGEMDVEELPFSPYNPDQKCGDSDPANCYGELDRKLKMTWWIKIKTKDGLVGWTNQGDNFDGKDSCG